MKKLISLLLALAMVIGLVACGAKPTAEPVVETTVAPTEEPIVAPTEEVVEATEEIVEDPTEEIVTEPVEDNPYVLAPETDFTWEDMGGQIAIVSYNGNKEYVEIPATINGVPVIAIRGDAFAKSAIVGIKMPVDLMTVCDNAFRNVTTLVEVKFSGWNALIGNNAFNGCTALTTVIMNNNMQVIMDGAFANCCALTHIDLPASIVEVSETAFDATTVVNYAQPIEDSPYVLAPESDFTWEEVEGVGGINATITSYVGDGEYVEIPSTIGGFPVGAIGSHAFKNSAVVGIKLPDSVYMISEEAFLNAADLVEIQFGDFLAMIRSNAFNGCTSLTTVVMNNNVQIIQDGAFVNCPALTHIDLPAMATDVSNTAFDDTTEVNKAQMD